MAAQSTIFLFKTAFFTGIALIAFAANSVLCRLALGEEIIDASSFTIIRLFSGIVTLLIILLITKQNNHERNTQKGSWSASFFLFFYAITFSFAYLTLTTGTGALILFGSVQITMIAYSMMTGHRLHSSEWIGVVLAFIGFIYLIYPDIATPSIVGFALMSLSGVAWGLYTLKGRGSKNPLIDTAYNFTRTLPLLIILAILSLSFNSYSFSSKGVILAILSGSIASGIGYTIWYSALRGLTAIQAAVLQLLVPVIAALGGVIFVSEAITLRLVISASLILGGIACVILGRYYFVQMHHTAKA